MHTLAYLTAGLLTIGLLNNTWKKESLLTLEEVCDNARDDDGDGLIDLNDPDCNCIVAEPVSLIRGKHLLPTDPGGTLLR